MVDSGTRPIVRSGCLILRALLAGAVAWGSGREAMRPSFDRMLVFIPPEKAPEVHRGVRYTVTHATIASRGWPLEFSCKTGMKDDSAPFPDQFLPVALTCDVVFVGVLMIASWLLLSWRRLRFGLADLLAATTALAVTMAFQIWAWDHDLDLSKIAIDVGVFSLAVAIIRFVGRCVARFRLSAQAVRAGDLRVNVRFPTDEMRPPITKRETSLV
jgi:hypothetical protein